MYQDFYALKTSPFNITCDPGVFFESHSHQEAIAALFYGIQERKGIILISGEVGTGKTTLCKVILNTLSSQVKTSVIFNPHFSEIQLLEAILDDFGLAVERKNRLEMFKKLYVFLVETSLAGGTAVVIIDEAQHLTNRQLEQIRLLSNLETTKEKLLQIVLLAQPELEERLRQPQLRQIRQRLFVKHTLAPLNQEEMKAYINFRLQKSGEGEIAFSPQGYDIIYEFSQGIPRLINMICERALLCGFVDGKKYFNEEMLERCAKELR